MEKLKDSVRIQGEGFLNSYVQVFFSENRWFSLILLAVSFLDIYAGMAGAVAVVTANLTAKAMGYDPWFIRKGFYGYNSLLVGLGFGLTFEPGLAFFALLVVAALLTFLITIAIQGFLYKYGLPFLSIPFILGFWILLLASSEFGALGLSGRGVYIHNEWYALGGISLVGWLQWFDGKEFDKENTALLREYFPAAGLALETQPHDAYYDVIASVAELAYYRAHLQHTT